MVFAVNKCPFALIYKFLNNNKIKQILQCLCTVMYYYNVLL